MPLPSPKKNQKKDDFIESCMGNPTMNRDFKNNKQRFAVCQSLWEKHNKKKADGSVNFEEALEEENKSPVWLVD